MTYQGDLGAVNLQHGVVEWNNDGVKRPSVTISFYEDTFGGVTLTVLEVQELIKKLEDEMGLAVMNAHIYE